ncbi:MAG: hypothetical protein NTX53_10120 [candidate division WOR-3 bacterium]|nr:hypothetical protein [candidate division WOR-3 bacterium]
MTTGAGGHTTAGASRYWRIAVTVFAWLTIVQAGLGFVGGLLAIPLAATFRPESLAPQLGPMLGGTDFSAIDSLFGQLRLFNFVQVVANCVICAGAIGLLLRRKWGWYLTVALNLVQAGASVLLGQPLLRKVLTVFDPTQAESFSYVMAVLIALIPISIVIFLVAKPVISQFEKRTIDTAVNQH